MITANASQPPISEPPRRLGVFGGTFDPIHKAHLEIARAALRHARLDHVLFVMAARPPHKPPAGMAPAKWRFAMVEAALAGESRMTASRLELERHGPSYTIDTLRTLHKQYPDAELFLILGMDSLVDLPQWRDPEGILALARPLVVPRPGDWPIPAAYQGRYDVLPFHETVLSSTEVRRRLLARENLDDFLPEAVARLIREKRIYARDH